MMMEITRRQFALSIAAASSLAFILIRTRCPHWVFPAASFLAGLHGRTIRRQ